MAFSGYPPPTDDSLGAKLSRLKHPGISHCLRCGYSWSAVKDHITHYLFSEDGLPKKGCFPLCEGCWSELGHPEARIEYYATLIEHWASNGSPISEDDKFDIGQAVANGR